MNNSDLIEKLRRLYPNLSKSLLKSMVCSVWESMSYALQQQQRIELRSFGSFFITERNHKIINASKKTSGNKKIKVINFRSSKKSKQILNDYRFD